MGTFQKLRIERPCRVRRVTDGRWCWHCWLCQPPLRFVISTADTWRVALEDANHHVRHEHGFGDADRQARQGWAA